jgi:hypothetical protein
MSSKACITVPLPARARQAIRKVLHPQEEEKVVGLSR